MHRDWPITHTNFSTLPTSKCRFVDIDETTAHVWFWIGNDGAAYGNLWTITLPFVAARTASQIFTLNGIVDNGTIQSAPGRMDTIAGSNIANLYKTGNPTSGLWSTSNGSRRAFTGIVYEKTQTQRRLIFEGNSLMNHAVNGDYANGHYIPYTIYNNIKGSHDLAVSSFAVPGRSQTEINADFLTKVAPYLQPGDIVDLWEGTNDLYLTGDSGAVCFDRLLTYSRNVRSLGCKIVVSTVIARDWAGNPPTYPADPADLMTRAADFNTLVLSNSTEFDAIADVAADSRFDTKADASNTTNYKTDKVHLNTTGQNAIIGIKSTALSSVL